MKKIYSINVHYRLVLPVEIEAESEEEAIRIAKESGEQYGSLNDYDYIEALDACVTGVEECEEDEDEDVDVDVLMERTINYMKDSGTYFISLTGSVFVTKTIIETSGGMMCDEHDKDYKVEGLYLDGDTLYVHYENPLYDSEEAPDDEPLDELGTSEILEILIDTLEDIL